MGEVKRHSKRKGCCNAEKQLQPLQSDEATHAQQQCKTRVPSSCICASATPHTQRKHDPKKRFRKHACIPSMLVAQKADCAMSQHPRCFSQPVTDRLGRNSHELLYIRHALQQRTNSLSYAEFRRNAGWDEIRNQQRSQKPQLSP